MSNIRDTPEKNAPDPILPEPIGEDAIVQPDDGSAEEGDTPQDGGRAPAQERANERRSSGPAPMHSRDDDTSAVPGRLMSEDEKLDEALEETFPTSDPIAPSRIDGPNN